MSDVLIIGAGPAGLAVAGRLRKAGIDFRIVDKASDIASSWRGHYDRLHLHTVKQLSHLPHQEFPSSYPTYVPREDLVLYFEEYSRKFNIKPDLNLEVNSLKREDEYWKVEFSDGSSDVAKHVVIATGVNHVPNIPHWSGEDSFQGTIIHSKKYKNPGPFVGKKVLVVGMGNTGAEIGLDLAEAHVDTSISVRSPVVVVPRDVMGNPVQLTAKKLERLPFKLGDVIGEYVRKLTIGDLSKYGVPMSDTKPTELLRKFGKTPVIDLGTVRMIKEGKIKVFPGISRFNNHSIVFTDNSEEKFDSVILATGYHPNLRKFVPQIDLELDENGFPKNAVSNVPQHEGLYFVGFDNYKVGGILGTIYNDSETVADAIETSLNKTS